MNNSLISNQEFKEIIKEQQDFFFTNKTKDINFRIFQLKKLKNILKENESLLYKAIHEDFGKSEFEVYITELAMIYHDISNNLKNIKKWSKRQKVSTGFANFPAKSYVYTEPLGGVLVIGPWNYPFLLSLAPAIAALAAGNTVILKPSELPSKSSQIMAQLINNHFSREYFCVIEGGVEATTSLLENRFDKIFFTGSIPVGKIIYQAASKHLTPVTLELGGKSPTFVLEDADLHITAKRLVWAKFINAGQTCVAPDYVLVHQSIENKFLQALKSEIELQYKCDENELGENYNYIINDKNYERLIQLIDNEKVFLGNNCNSEKRIICPTVLQNVSFDDPIMQDEIFGPILPVIPFTNLEEVIKKVKERPKPLACYFYTKNRKAINKLISEISFGGGCVNESIMHLTNSKLPFGGVGYSGMGSYHGKTGFDTFSHKKSIMDKPIWLELKIKYSPYTKFKRKIIKWLLE